jgi:hypothetical protein
MAKYEAPSLAQWKQLYEAVVAFKATKCWEWMYDDDVFGVKDPKTGEVAYCCILGNAGQQFGIATYLGQEGLKFLLDLLFGDSDPDDVDVFMQKSLVCYLVDREELHSQDLNTIKEVGMKFRGKKQWPLLRSYEPGMVPWYLDAEQCRFFTHILYQAIDVAMRCKENKDILTSDSALTFLVRVAKTDADQNLIWEDQYITVEPPANDFISFHLKDQALLHKLKMMKKQPALVLEADAFSFPAAVGEKDERPYFPTEAILVDHKTGLILSYNMFTNIRHEGYKAIEMLIDFIMKNNVLPSKLLVQNDECYYLFKDLCQQLDIELKIAARLKNIESVKKEMKRYMK